MKNIKSYEEFVNENYEVVDEGLFSKKTIEDWWESKRLSVSPAAQGGVYHSNRDYIKLLVDKGTAHDLTPEEKDKIELEAIEDKFKGEIYWHPRKKEWVYKPSKNINIANYDTGPPGPVGTNVRH